MANPIQYQSALPQLLTQLMGTQQKTGGSSSSTTSNANTDPLMQIFGQQMGASTPAGMQALLGELFQTGAQQVPVLTDAYANSRGARSSNNSGLSLALAELNKGLTGQAATLLGKQQADTAQTASAIANATRGTTTQNSGATTTTGNPKAAAGLGLAGFGLNAADKLGLLKGVKGSVGNMFGGGATAGAGTFAPVLDFNSGLPTYDSYDLQGTNLLTGGGPGAFDTGAGSSFGFGMDGTDFGLGGMDFGVADFDSIDMGFDPSQYTDWSGGFADSGGVLDEAALGGAGFENYDAYDLQNVGGDSSWFDGIGDSIGSFFGFKDGGLVKKESLFDRRRAAIDAAEEAATRGDDTNAAYQERLRRQAAEGKKPNKYADGGLVSMSSYATAPFNHRMRLMPMIPAVRTVPTGSRFGYADGGMVRRPMRYADGGMIRNRNYMGGPLSRGAGSGAFNVDPNRAQQGMGGPVNSPSMSSQSGGSLSSGDLMANYGLYRETLAADARRKEERRGPLGGDASTNSNATVGTPASNNAAVAGMGMSALGLGLTSALGPIGALASMAISQMSNTPTMQSIAINGLVNALGGGGPGSGGPGDNDSANAAANAASPTNSPAAVSMDTQAQENAAIAAAAAASAGGSGDAPGEGGGVGGTGASAGDASSGEGGTGGGSGDGTGGTSASAADGGKISGSGTGISDSIDIKASDGEFVFSADVVEMLGADLLQNIQNRLHTPAAVQKAAGAR